MLIIAKERGNSPRWKIAPKSSGSPVIVLLHGDMVWVSLVLVIDKIGCHQWVNLDDDTLLTIAQIEDLIRSGTTLIVPQIPETTDQRDTERTSLGTHSKRQQQRKAGSHDQPDQGA